MLHHYCNDTSCSKETYSQSAAINKGMKHWSKVLFIGACMQQMFALHSPFPRVFHLTFSNRSYIRCTLYRKRSVKVMMLRIHSARQWVNSQFTPVSSLHHRNVGMSSPVKCLFTQHRPIRYQYLVGSEFKGYEPREESTSLPERASTQPRGLS